MNTSIASMVYFLSVYDTLSLLSPQLSLFLLMNPYPTPQPTLSSRLCLFSSEPLPVEMTVLTAFVSHPSADAMHIKLLLFFF